MLLSFPPTALALLSKSRCLVGGGGGSAKTGVPNRAILYVNGSTTLQQKGFLDFGDDRVVGLCAHPKEDLVICTTAGGNTHILRFTDTDLKIAGTVRLGKAAAAAAAAGGGDATGPSQRAIAVSPAGDRVAVSLGSNVALAKYQAGSATLEKTSELSTSECHTEDLREIAFHPKADLLLTLDDGAAALWSLAPGKDGGGKDGGGKDGGGGRVALLRPDAGGPAGGPAPVGQARPKFRGAAFDSDGAALYVAASSSKGGLVLKHSCAADGTLKPTGARYKCRDPITALAIGALHLVIGTAEGEVLLLSLDRLQLVYARPGLHNLPITKVGLLREGDGLGGWRAGCEAGAGGVTVSLGLDKACNVTYMMEAMMERDARNGWRLLLAFVILVLVMLVVVNYEEVKALLSA